ncbi:MAG TPA: hypothetical protein VFS87_02180 [Qipengyuania sp.]|nr:hypothetical protein [Qipengyuania sp.]
MQSGHGSYEQTYRLDIGADRNGDARTIEFGASGAEALLIQAQRHCPGRIARITVGDRALGSLQLTQAGFWVLGGRQRLPMA